MKKPLTDAELLELREAFDLFDDDKTGRLSAQNLETLARALGLQITKSDARARVRVEKTRRGDPHCGIDFGTACSVLERWVSPAMYHCTLLTEFSSLNAIPRGRSGRLFASSTGTGRGSRSGI